MLPDGGQLTNQKKKKGQLGLPFISGNIQSLQRLAVRDHTRVEGGALELFAVSGRGSGKIPCWITEPAIESVYAYTQGVSEISITTHLSLCRLHGRYE